MILLFPVIEIVLSFVGVASFYLHWSIAFYVIAVFTFLRWLPYIAHGSQFFKELVVLLVFTITHHFTNGTGLIDSFALGTCLVKGFFDLYYLIKYFSKANQFRKEIK